MEKILQVKNVYKKYPNKKKFALKNISLDIFKGEILSLLGVNGAGKTTLFSLISGLHPTTSGDIIFEDEKIENNFSIYKSNIGCCPQKPNLDSTLNVYDNLWFAGTFFNIEKKQLKEKIEDLGKKFNLKKYFNSEVKELSGGYKQRLLIARALIHEPKIILLDEPTVGLDPDVRRNIWNLILDLKNEGRTVILTTHYLDEAEFLSDRLCILDKGEVLMIENSQNLKKTYNKQNLEDVFLHLMKEDKQYA